MSTTSGVDFLLRRSPEMALWGSGHRVPLLPPRPLPEDGAAGRRAGSARRTHSTSTARELRLRDDARRFETGTYTLPQAWTASGGMGIMLEVGVEQIRARNQELTPAIIEPDRRDRVWSCSRRATIDERGGLVRLRIPGGRERAETILHQLFERNVVLDSRHDSVRISPHFFNTEEDLDRCFRELRSSALATDSKTAARGRPLTSICTPVYASRGGPIRLPTSAPCDAADNHEAILSRLLLIPYPLSLTRS